MHTRRTFLLSPLALAAASAWQPAAAATPKPNVVLIIATNWPAFAVPWAGDSNLTTPNIAKLANGGVTFSRAYACCARSDRARLCLLKGVFPNKLAGPRVSVAELANEAASLHAVFNQAGYRTSAFDSLQVDDIISFVHAPSAQPFYAEWTFDNVAARLMERMPFEDLHLRRNVPQEMQAKAKLDLSTFYARAHTRDLDIGLVLRALDRPGLDDNTIVVFTSDHGEQFGSHGLHGHDVAFEESIRIPLAIRFPGAIKAGSQNGALISQTDIMPSLLRMCGVAPPESVQGRDVSGLMLDVAGAEPPDSIYAMGKMDLPGTWRMVVRGYDKAVINADSQITELFNLADDPLELTNLSEAPSQELNRASLLALQKNWARRLGDGVDGSGLKTR